MSNFITPRFLLRRLAINYVSGSSATPGQEIELVLDWRKLTPYVDEYANSYDSLTPTIVGGGVLNLTSDTPSGKRWSFTAPATSRLITVRIVSAQYDLNQTVPKTFDHTYGVWCKVGEPEEVEVPESIDTVIDVGGVPTPVTYPIDPTGTINCTDGLKAFFASVPDGTLIRFESSNTYRSEYKIPLVNRWGLEIVDPNIFTTSTVTKDVDPLRARFKQLEYVGGGQHILRNPVITGSRPVGATTYTEEFETWHNIATAGVNGLRIIDPILRNPHGDFINPGFLIMDGFLGLHNNWPSWDVEISGSYALVDEEGYLTGAEGIIGGYMDNCGRMAFGMTANPRMWAHHLKIGNVQRSLWDEEPGEVSMWMDEILIEHIRIFGRVRNNWIANAGSGEYIDGMEVGWMAGVGSPIRCDINGAKNRNRIHLHHFKSEEPLKSGNSPFEIAGWTDPRVENMAGVIQAGRDSPAVRLVNIRGTPIIENVVFENQRVTWRWEEVTGAKVVKTTDDKVWHYIVQRSGGSGTFIPGETLTFTVRAITGAKFVSIEDGFIRFDAASSQKPQVGSVVTGVTSGATTTLGEYVHRDRIKNIFRITEDGVVIYGDPDAEPPSADPDDEEPEIPTVPGGGDVALVRRARLIRTAAGWVGSRSFGALIGG